MIKTSSEQILAISLGLILVLIAPQISIGQLQDLNLTVTPENATVGENITINATGFISLNLTQLTVEIQTPTKTLTFRSKSGEAIFPVEYQTEETGIHEILLVSKFPREVLSNISINITPAIINITNTTQNITQNVTNVTQNITENTTQQNITQNQTQNITQSINQTQNQTTNVTVNQTQGNATQNITLESPLNFNATNTSNISEIVITDPVPVKASKRFKGVKNSENSEIETRIKFYKEKKEVFDSKFEENPSEMGEFDVELEPLIKNFVKVKLEKVNYTGNFDFGIEGIDRELDIEEQRTVEAFAIDPSRMEFETGIVTKVATGNQLWKCKDWNFTTQTCFGNWVKIMDLTPGQEYNITINSTDPGFGEIIITKATHLDENRTYVSDIYEEVRKLDNNWSETIPDGNYVRVTFEKNLTSINDITIYPRTISGTPRIEIYEKNETILVAEFTSINDNEYNTVILTNLTGIQDTFDLRILNGDVQFDHIIDPSSTDTADSGGFTNTAGTGTSIDVGNVGNTQSDDDTEWRFGYQDGAGQAAVDFQLDLAFNVSSLNISGSQIMNISVTVRSCWTGGTGSDCGVVDQPEFNSGTNGEFRVYLDGADNELLDCVSAQCEATDEVLLGDFDSNPAWGTAYTENVFQFQKVGGFEAGDVVDGFLNLTLRTNGTNHNVNFEVEQRVDYVVMTIAYNTLPTTPTNIRCNNSNDCNVTVTHTLNINASGSTDAEGDNITYFIEALLQNVTNFQNASNVTKAGSGGVNGTGGTITTNESYTLHTFTSNGTFQVLSGEGDVEALIVGGGAAGGTGGTAGRGGGGSGGLVHDSAYPVTVNSYTVTVGSGGVPGIISTTSGSGGDSEFDTLTALGGGGAGPHANPGTAGGSGGGGSGYSAEAGGAGNQPGSASGGFGNAGGASFNGGGAPGRQGGGGGTGAVGQDGQSGSGGAGGVGLEYSQFASVGGSPDGWFGGGGGGGASSGTSAGSGGQGGGGAGGSGVAGTAGTANTGGGGGGSTTTGGAGGSGIVIVRYLTSPASNETNTSYTTYNDINSNYNTSDNITITVEVDSYNPEASVFLSTNYPDLFLEMYNGTGWYVVGAFNLNETYTGTGLNTTNVNFSLSTTNSTILDAWLSSSNQDFRIKGILVDYHNVTVSDEINYTNVFVTMTGKKWLEIGNHTNETTLDWNTTNVPEQNCVDLRARAIDLDGSNTFTDYFTKEDCLNISRPPAITNTVLNATLLNQSHNVRLNATITDELSIVVLATVLFPNGTRTNFSMAQDIGDIWFLDFNLTNQTGIYNITNIIANDSLGNINNTAYTTLNFEVNISPPSIFTLLLPPNATESTNTLPNLSWEQTSEPDFRNYTILIDNNVDFSSPEFTYYNLPVNNISRVVDSALSSDLTYYWRVIAYDIFGNSRNSTDDFIYITDNTNPGVTLNLPGNGNFVTQSSFNFNYTPSDTNTVNNCTLYGNFSGTFLLNQTNTTINKGVPNFFGTTLQDGGYIWNVLCVDRANNSAFASSNFTVLVDTTSPTINLESPANSTEENVTNNIVFFYNVSDIMTSVSSCEVIVDDTVEDTDVTIAEGITQNFTVFVPNGMHNWSINCTDANGFEGSSFRYNLSVNVLSESDPPVVVLNFPGVEQYLDTSTITFNYTPNDATGIENCSIYFGDQLNQTNSTVNNQQSNYFTVNNFTNQEYTWRVECVDNNTFALGTSASRNFTVDLIDPTVTLNTPIDNGMEGSSAVTFNYTPVDTNAANCTLYGNFSGTFTSDQTNTTINSGVPNFFNINPADGVYIWNVLCIDRANRSSFAPANYTVSVDATAPIFSNIVVDPSSPTPYDLPKNYTFNITWKDMFLDTVIIESNFTGTLQNQTLSSSNENFTFTVSNLVPTSYVYRWIANDTLGKTNQTQQFTYVVERAQTVINLTLNATQNNISILEEQTINITSRLVTPPTGTIEMFLSGDLIANESSPITNITFFPKPGSYNVTVIYEQTQNYTAATEVLFITVNDTTNPVVSLIFPQHNATVANPSVTFQYNVTDESVIQNCTLYINGTLNQTDTIVIKNITQTFSEDLLNGSYSWRVDCVDSANNLGQSITNNFTIQQSSTMNVNVNTSKSIYQQGEFAIITNNVTDAFNNSLNSTVTTDVIKGNTTVPWWNQDWQIRMPLNVVEPDNMARGETIVQVNVTGLAGNITNCDQMRIVEHEPGGTLLDSRVYGGDDNEWCLIRFFGDISASENTSNSFYAYYNNSGASALTVSRSFEVFIVEDDGEDAGQAALWNLDPYANDTAACGWWDWDDPDGYTTAQPENDVTGGAGVNALFTGPTGDNSVCTGTDGDIDGGFTFMTSPAFNLSGWLEVNLTLYRWYYSNDNGGNNDDMCRLRASTNNGTSYNYTLFELTDDDIGGDADGYNQWTRMNYTLADIVSNINDQFRMEVLGNEFGDGDIVECGMDEFEFYGTLSNVQATSLTAEEHIIRFTNDTGLDGIEVFSWDTINEEFALYTAATLAENILFNNASGYALFQVVPDTTPPNITLNAPISEFNTSSQSVNFNWTANDYHRNQTCNLTIDGSINQSGIFVDNNVYVNRTINNLVEGTHFWNVTCIDSLGNFNTTQIRNFTVDLTPPNINLNFPGNNSNFSTNILNFNWTAADNFHTAPLCNVTIDSVIQASDVVSLNNTPTNQTISGILNGTRRWNVTCVDVVGNVGDSTTFTFVLLAAPENMTIELLQNLEDVRINWTSVPEAISYSIYYSGNFTQGFGPTPNVTGITDLNYTDTTANLTTRRFYMVSAVRGEAQSNLSTIGGKYNKTLNTSFNLISFPLIPLVTDLENGTNAGYEFALQPQCLISLWKYNGTGFERTDWNGTAFNPVPGSENFTSLNMTTGYWLEANTTCDLTIVGIVPSQNHTVPLQQNWSLVGWHSAEEKKLPTDSEPVLLAVTPANSIQAIDRYNAVTGEFEVTTHFDIGGTPWGWFPSFNNPEFVRMDPMTGYYFDVTQTATWEHEP